MDAGMLTRRVTIQQPGTGRDAIGQPLQDWQDVVQVWADVRFPSGLETIKAGAEVAVTRASVRIRHRGGIDAGMRCLIDGRAFDIEAVLPDAQRVFLDLVCKG